MAGFYETGVYIFAVSLPLSLGLDGFVADAMLAFGVV